MHWWYDDVFINRKNHNALEPRSHSRPNRGKATKRIVQQVSDATRQLANQIKQAARMRQAAMTMSRLNDSQLHDIGLNREDLNRMHRGKPPLRYNESETATLKPPAVRLIAADRRRPKTAIDSREFITQKAA